MEKLEYEKKRDDLIKRWKKARPEYSSEGKSFTLDGIVNYEKWGKAKPKILFLLKENHDKKYEPFWGITVDNKPFAQNIAYWRQLLVELCNNPAQEISFPDITLPKGLDDIALVEVKKLNEGKSSSTYNEILKFAAKDKDFLKEQIELIDPNIVLCCYTADAYGDHIYDDSWEALSFLSKPRCACYKHRNRLVIDFFHPSARKSSMELFNLLFKLLKDGKVFDHFDWSKKG